MSSHKGLRTPWFLRANPPVRPGTYECGVRWTIAMRQLTLWDLEWDGKGFLVPFPMVVHQWRGLRKKPAPTTDKGQP